jgi:hypothetical protein
MFNKQVSNSKHSKQTLFIQNIKINMLQSTLEAQTYKKHEGDKNVKRRGMEPRGQKLQRREGLANNVM